MEWSQDKSLGLKLSVSANTPQTTCGKLNTAVQMLAMPSCQA